MPIMRMNHAVLYVRDTQRTKDFYTDVLGFTVRAELGAGAAFLAAPGSTNDHDLGIFGIGDQAGDSDAGRRTVGLYHLAWEVDTLGELATLAGRLSDVGALVGATDHGTTKSLYAKDPDGLEFEVAWLLPADQLTPEVAEATRANPLRRLDLAAEIAFFGADRLGGVGVSIPARA